MSNIREIKLPPDEWQDDNSDKPAQEAIVETLQEGLDGAERVCVFYIKLDNTGAKRKYTTCFHDITRASSKVAQVEMAALLQREINRILDD